MDEKKNCWMQGGDTLTKVVCGPSMFTFEDWRCRLKGFLMKAPLSKFKLQGRNRCPGSPYTCLSDKAMRQPRSQDPYPGSWPSPGARWEDLETRLGYAHAYGDGHVTDVLNLLFNFFFFSRRGMFLPVSNVQWSKCFLFDELTHQGLRFATTNTVSNSDIVTAANKNNSLRFCSSW